MLLWFAVLAPVVVAEVFRSPLVDYRLVAVGALAPLIELALPRPIALHTLLAPVVMLTVVMATTSGRRLVRRRLLGIPIGLFLHLVLDGTWTRTELFWWPAFASALGSAPEADRSPLAVLIMEMAAVAVAVWAWQRYDLADGANRGRLLRDGHLTRGALA